jgi:Domain of Unknown Function (DUF1080)
MRPPSKPSMRARSAELIPLCVLRRAACALIVVAVACGQNRNQLTPKEAADGWLLLYDGQSAFGWTPEGGAEWVTGADGDLSAKSGDSGDMVFNTIFGDYQLVCDIKSPVAKGSGLVLNGVAIPAPKSGDKWHTYSVTVSGAHLAASLDGRKVLDRDVNAPGAIALHYRKGDQFTIRQLKLRPTAGDPIFNGKNLSGWRVVAGEKAAAWSVRDGMIHVERGPGQLETQAKYRDFVLSLEVRSNSKEFLTKTVVARGRHFSLFANGILVTDVDDAHPAGSMAGKEEVKVTNGNIGLEAHDATTSLDFRNIRVAELR